MKSSLQLHDQVIAQAQKAMALNIAFIGIANHLFVTLADIGKTTPDELAAKPRGFT